MREEQLKEIVRRYAREMKRQGKQPWLAQYEEPAGIPQYDLERFRKLLKVELTRISN